MPSDGSKRSEFIQRSVEEKEIIEQGLACLNPGQRRIMELWHFEGHTLREISQMEGKELGAIKNRSWIESSSYSSVRFRLENDDGNFPAGQILLVFQAAVLP